MAAYINADYNHNFCFAVPESLESDRVVLVPFIPSKHAEPFITQAVHVPDLLAHLTIGPFRDVQHFVTEFLQDRQKDPGFLLFAVYDKSSGRASANPSESTSTGTFAGIIALKESSVSHLKAEIGTVVILPKFQKTHVASNAVGLLLHYALDLPRAVDAGDIIDSDSQSLPEHNKSPVLALGLRRVSWAANSHNETSIRLAERLGFRKEGILRWDRVMPKDRKTMGIGNGSAVRNGDARLDCVGRDTVLFSLCWDDWESGGREKVDGIMAREK